MKQDYVVFGFFCNKNNKGITLIALVITIVLMLILTTITINLTVKDDLFNYTQETVSKTEDAQDMQLISQAIMEYTIEKKTTALNKTLSKFIEAKKWCKNIENNEDNSITVTMSKNNKQYVIDKLKRIYSIENYTPGKIIRVGDFIEYNVIYCDWMDNSSETARTYTQTNGWRLLAGDENDDGTYSNVKIISTGKPGYINIDPSSNTNSEWFVKDNNILAKYKKIIAGENEDKYSLYVGEDDYPSLYVSAGLYYNFGQLLFKSLIGDASDNTAHFRKPIITDGITYDDTVLKTGEELFNLFGNKATVRTLTLSELNQTLKRDKWDSIEDISEAEDTTGLFRLDQLKNVAGMENYAYTTNSGYLFASPPPFKDEDQYGCDAVNSKENIEFINSDQKFTNDSNRLFGYRPLICLNCNVRLEDTNGNGVPEIIPVN